MKARIVKKAFWILFGVALIMIIINSVTNSQQLQNLSWLICSIVSLLGGWLRGYSQAVRDTAKAFHADMMRMYNTKKDN